MKKKVSKIAIDERILEVIAAIALPFQSDSRTLLGRWPQRNLPKKCCTFSIFSFAYSTFCLSIFLFPSLLSWLNGLVNGFTMQIDSWYATVSLKTDDLMEDERRKRRPQIPVERLVLVKRQGELDGVYPITKNWPKFHLPAQKWRLFSDSCRSRFAI